MRDALIEISEEVSRLAKANPVIDWLHRRGGLWTDERIYFYKLFCAKSNGLWLKIWICVATQFHIEPKILSFLSVASRKPPKPPHDCRHRNRLDDHQKRRHDCPAVTVSITTITTAIMSSISRITATIASAVAKPKRRVITIAITPIIPVRVGILVMVISARMWIVGARCCQQQQQY